MRVFLGFSIVLIAAAAGLPGCNSTPPATPDPTPATAPAPRAKSPHGNLLSQREEVDRFTNGKVRSRAFLKRYADNTEIRDGLYQEFYSSGQPFCSGQYRDNQRDGAWKYWNKDGTLARTEEYADGKLNGPFVSYRADGTRQSEGMYVNNQKEGLWTEEFDATGQKPLEQITYRADQVHGVVASFYESGQKRKEYHFTDGLKDGLFSDWYPNGKKKTEKEFKRGIADGKEVIYNESGEVLTAREFRDNHLVERMP